MRFPIKKYAENVIINAQPVTIQRPASKPVTKVVPNAIPLANALNVRIIMA